MSPDNWPPSGPPDDLPLDRDDVYQTESEADILNGRKALLGPEQANYMRRDAFQVHHKAGARGQNC